MTNDHIATAVRIISAFVVSIPLTACDVADAGEMSADSENIQGFDLPERDPALDEIGVPRAPLAAPGYCYWEYAETTSSNEIRTDPCQTLGGEYPTFPISGGCHTDADRYLKVSIPLEFNGSGIDDDEVWTEGYRWLCRFSGAPTSGTAHRAWALCCVDD